MHTRTLLPTGCREAAGDSGPRKRKGKTQRPEGRTTEGDGITDEREGEKWSEEHASSLVRQRLR